MRRWLVPLTGLLAVAFAAPAMAAENCLPLSNMRTTKPVDNRTIVVTMRDGTYRKIALASNCVGLKIQGGFAYETSISQLCPSDIITVLGGGGDRCGIATITPLESAEAKSLLAKR